MMHVRFSLVTTDPPTLAGCIAYLKDEARPVLESQHGSLGLSLLEEPGVLIFESFWATKEALLLSEETEAAFRGELARRVKRPVRAEDYQVAVFEQEGPPGEANQLTRMKVKPTGVADVITAWCSTRHGNRARPGGETREHGVPAALPRPRRHGRGRSRSELTVLDGGEADPPSHVVAHRHNTCLG
jgi:hypothetical protein